MIETEYYCHKCKIKFYSMCDFVESDCYVDHYEHVELIDAELMDMELRMETRRKSRDG
jgi:hypothetical protein